MSALLWWISIESCHHYKPKNCFFSWHIWNGSISYGLHQRIGHIPSLSLLIMEYSISVKLSLLELMRNEKHILTFPLSHEDEADGMVVAHRLGSILAHLRQLSWNYPPEHNVGMKRCLAMDGNKPNIVETGSSPLKLCSIIILGYSTQVGRLLNDRLADQKNWQVEKKKN